MAEQEKEKTNKPIPKKPRFTFMTLTLKECDKLGIALKDWALMKEVSLNLSWDKIIKTINYLAKKRGQASPLSWENTFEEAMSIIPDFLV